MFSDADQASYFRQIGLRAAEEDRARIRALVDATLRPKRTYGAGTVLGVLFGVVAAGGVAAYFVLRREGTSPAAKSPPVVSPAASPGGAAPVAATVPASVAAVVQPMISALNTVVPGLSSASPVGAPGLANYAAAIGNDFGGTLGGLGG